MVRLLYKSEVLHESLEMSFNLQLDGAPARKGRAKWRYWEDEIRLNN